MTDEEQDPLADLKAKDQDQEEHPKANYRETLKTNIQFLHAQLMDHFGNNQVNTTVNQLSDTVEVLLELMIQNVATLSALTETPDLFTVLLPDVEAAFKAQEEKYEQVKKHYEKLLVDSVETQGNA